MALLGGDNALNAARHTDHVRRDGTLYHACGRDDYRALQVNFPLHGALYLDNALAPQGTGHAGQNPRRRAVPSRALRQPDLIGQQVSQVLQQDEVPRHGIPLEQG